MWLADLEWDQKLPAELHNKWIDFRSELPRLERIEIPRWVNCHFLMKLAYSAAIYSCIRCPNDNVFTNLLLAKTKVSPVNTISIPRLELCGALLLFRLGSCMKGSLNFQIVPIHA